MIRLILLAALVCATVPAAAQPVGVSDGDAEGDVAAVSLFGDARAGYFCPTSSVCSGGLAVSVAGDSSSTAVCAEYCLGGNAVSATGNATACPAGYLPCVAASGTQGADGSFAASGTGDAHGFLAASGTGDARGAEWMEGTIAVSGTGDAEGDTAVSGCDVAACALVRDVLP